MPVSGGPDVGDRGHLWIFLGDPEFDPEVGIGLEVAEFVNDLEAGILSEMIDSGEINQVIEPELVPAELGDLPDFGGLDDDAEFAPELGEQGGIELGAEGAEGGGEGRSHGIR